MRYLLNIGNTRTAVAELRSAGELFTAETPVRHFPTSQFLTAWSPDGDCAADWHATGSSVVPAVRAALEARYPGRIHFISPEDYPQIDCSAYGNLRRLGTDRLANIAAAHALLPGRAALVLDCGTALNSVCVSAEGRFLGGVILPGRETAIRALAENTAQLPEFAVTAPHEFTPFGRTPEDAIRNGIDLAMIGAAEKIVRQTLAYPEMADAVVWFTGGDAPFFVENLPVQLRAQLPPMPLTLFGIGLVDR